MQQTSSHEALGLPFMSNFYQEVCLPFIQNLFSLFFCYFNSRNADLPGTRRLGISWSPPEKKTKWLEAALHNFCSLILALSASLMYLPPSLSSPFSLQRCKNQNKPRREIIHQGWSRPLIKATEIPLCAKQAESSLPAPGYGLFKEILSHHNLKEGYLTFLSFVSISSIGTLCVSQNN